MNTSDLLFQIGTFFSESFNYNDCIFDQANNPFVQITIMGDDRVITHSMYVVPDNKYFSSKYPTPVNYALACTFQAGLFNQWATKKSSVTFDFGFCDGFDIDGLVYVIAVVAMPDDAKFVYQSLANQIRIIHGNFV